MITIDPPSTPHIVSSAVSGPAVSRFLHRAQRAIGLGGSVSVLLTSDAELKRLNRSFRGKNKATDVLSFPADPIPGLPAGHAHAGDLAISLDTAARQAEQFGHTLAIEVRVLLLHGLLHLAGFDHEVDRGEMAGEELRLRAELRLPVSLIARTGAPPASNARRPRAAIAARATTPTRRRAGKVRA